MSYTLINELSNGLIRYRFKIYINGVQFKHHETCKKSAVLNLYTRWENEVRERIKLKEQKQQEEESKSKLPMLFEAMHQYLENVDANYFGRMVGYTFNIFKYFKECYDDMLLEEFRISHVKDYISWRRTQVKQRGSAPLSDRTINREIAELSKFFTWSIERELYTKINPCFNQKIKGLSIKREVFLTSEQIEELLEKAREEGDLIFSAILIALSTGFRRGEMFELQFKDIDFKHSRIYLRASTTKGNKSRVVAIPNYLVEHFQEMREQARDKEGRVFQEWSTVDWYRNAFERIRNKLSFNPLPNGTSLHIHDLRHVYAQCLRDQGVALQDIQAFLGHSSVTVTEKFYAQAGGKDAKQKVEKLAEVILFRKIS